MRAAKVQASLRIRAVSPEPSLLAHTSSESRGTFRQKARSLAPRNGWACAVKICHDGMLEDTNSLDGAQLTKTHTTTYYVQPETIPTTRRQEPTTDADRRSTRQDCCAVSNVLSPRDLNYRAWVQRLKLEHHHRFSSRMRCPTGIQEVAGSILGPATYLS